MKRFEIRLTYGQSAFVNARDRTHAISMYYASFDYGDSEILGVYEIQPI